MNPVLIQILKHEGVASIVTSNKGKPYVTATWNTYIEIETDGRLLIPAGGLSQTEQNLQVDQRMTLLIGSRLVPGRSSMGTGLRLTGIAEFIYVGHLYDNVKVQFPWARAVLHFTIEKTEQLL